MCNAGIAKKAQCDSDCPESARWFAAEQRGREGRLTLDCSVKIAQQEHTKPCTCRKEAPVFPFSASGESFLQEAVAERDNQIAHYNRAQSSTVGETSHSYDHEPKCDVSQAIELYESFDEVLLFGSDDRCIDFPDVEHHVRAKDAGESKRELEYAKSSGRVDCERGLRRETKVRHDDSTIALRGGITNVEGQKVVSLILECDS